MPSLTSTHVDQVDHRYRVVHLTGAYTLSPYENVVRVTASAATGSYTVKLPSAAECDGVTFSIFATSISGATVTLNSTGENWADITMNATGNLAVLRSDGRRWTVLERV